MINELIHPWMDDIDEHLNDIQMDERHSSIIVLYLSLQFVQVLW